MNLSILEVLTKRF